MIIIDKVNKSGSVLVITRLKLQPAHLLLWLFPTAKIYSITRTLRASACDSARLVSRSPNPIPITDSIN
jgi:hypothetical protein